MTVYVLLRNETQSTRRVFLGVFKSETGARQALVDDMNELDGLYSEADYDIITTPLEE